MDPEELGKSRRCDTIVDSGVALFASWDVGDNGGGWDSSLYKKIDGVLGRLVPVSGEEEVKGALVGALDLHAGKLACQCMDEPHDVALASVSTADGDTAAAEMGVEEDGVTVGARVGGSVG